MPRGVSDVVDWSALLIDFVEAAGCEDTWMAHVRAGLFASILNVCVLLNERRSNTGIDETQSRFPPCVTT
jgi:uncharacterized membrane protein